MHFEERPQADTESRILPLINVVFLLLIFFMIAGGLSASEPFEVNAPYSQSQGEVEKPVLRILLGPEGRLALNSVPMGLEELLAAVRDQIGDDADLDVQLKADGAVAGNQVVLLMEQLNAVGVASLRLLTLPAKP